MKKSRSSDKPITNSPPPITSNRSRFQTPMMQQYLELKLRYPDCVLFFRLGDFYELFLDDAETCAKILGITLTRRTRGKDGRIPMCGIPYHAVEHYLPKLVENGFKVAIAEQISNPSDSPTLVTRDVVRVVTAGTMIEGRSINEKESSFVCAVHLVKKKIALACADLATGEFIVKHSTPDTLSSELYRYHPKEVLVSETVYNNTDSLGFIHQAFQTNITTYPDWDRWTRNAEQYVCQHFQVSSLRGFGLEDEILTQVSSALLGYLSYTQHGRISHLKKITVQSDQQKLVLDPTTIESLELFQSSMDKSYDGSVLSVIDQTLTAMGARQLRQWLANPLSNLAEIQARLQGVEELVESTLLRAHVRQELNQITDMERQLSKLAVAIGNARDVVALRTNLEIISHLHQLLKESHNFNSIFSQIVKLQESLTQYLLDWIEDDPPGITKIGGIIKAGRDPKLDELRSVYHEAAQWITEFEAQERARTGIGSLKVGFNSVFGYYIEITHAHRTIDVLQFGYERTQTLVNAERYSTTELKIQEKKVLQSKEKAEQLEQDIFEKIIQRILQYSEQIQDLAKSVGFLDCLSNFAQLAVEKKYCKPQMSTQPILQIKNGRHPVVEKYVGNQFVPNSTQMDSTQRFFLITGPNMAGKSTYIRQVALIVLLAHIGCYVPADSATISIRDRIFSRIGASDALHKGLSTFMVEMTETAKILHQLTDKSLVIFDEIGRGTGVDDGLSLAQAIAEYVASIPEQPFTFFATHYHELSQLADLFESIQNYSMAVEFHKKQLIFLRTLIEGNSTESFGIEIAKQAGIPPQVTGRAEKLKQLNKKVVATKNSETDNNDSSEQSINIISEIKNLDIDQLTPKQALDALFELQKILRHSELVSES